MQGVSKHLKRPYLGDLKPFAHVYSPLNIITQSANACIFTSVRVMDQYNLELKEFKENQQTDDDEDFEFDWKVMTFLFLPIFIFIYMYE